MPTQAPKSSTSIRANSSGIRAFVELLAPRGVLRPEVHLRAVEAGSQFPLHERPFGHDVFGGAAVRELFRRLVSLQFLITRSVVFPCCGAIVTW